MPVVWSRPGQSSVCRAKILNVGVFRMECFGWNVSMECLWARQRSQSTRVGTPCHRQSGLRLFWMECCEAGKTMGYEMATRMSPDGCMLKCGKFSICAWTNTHLSQLASSDFACLPRYRHLRVYPQKLAILAIAELPTSGPRMRTSARRDRCSQRQRRHTWSAVGVGRCMHSVRIIQE